jgi:hypothetical protein
MPVPSKSPGAEKPLQAWLRVPQASLDGELQRMFLRYLALE